jgi:hypothetical protein
MKSSSVIFILILLIAVVGYYFYYQKNRKTTDEEKEISRELLSNLLEEQNVSEEQILPRGNGIENVCPNPSTHDMWFAISNGEIVRGRTAVIKKNDGKFKPYGLEVGGVKLLLTNTTDVSNYVLTEGSNTSKPKYFGKAANGWIVMIDRELTTTVCVSKSKKSF